MCLKKQKGKYRKNIICIVGGNMLEKNFNVVINNIKQEIKNIQYKVAVASNINLISMYFRLGRY